VNRLRLSRRLARVAAWLDDVTTHHAQEGALFYACGLSAEKPTAWQFLKASRRKWALGSYLQKRGSRNTLGIMQAEVRGISVAFSIVLTLYEVSYVIAP
jgi:hypothetical protein